MVRRHVRSDFAADVYVFPGGKVEGADRSPPGEALVEGDGLLRLRVAAARELFEETGVLLARGKTGDELSSLHLDPKRLERYREQVHAGTISLFDVLHAEGLRLAIDRLTPISRWITPESLPRRFDTYFFLAPLPEGQEPLHDAVETTDGVWIEPAEALARFWGGDFPLVFATQKHLERLARFASPQELAATVSARDLDPVMPRIIQRGEETLFLLPGDEGY